MVLFHKHYEFWNFVCVYKSHISETDKGVISETFSGTENAFPLPLYSQFSY